jgi:hypothetical protein
MFGHYATRTLDGDCRVATTAKDPEARFRRMSRLRMNRIGRELLASDEDIAEVLRKVRDSEGGARVGDLLRDTGAEVRARWELTLGWLAKMDILKVVS